MMMIALLAKHGIFVKQLFVSIVSKYKLYSGICFCLLQKKYICVNTLYFTQP